MPNSPIIGKQDFQDSNHNLVFSVDPDSFLAQITMKALAVFETMVGNSALLNGTVGELLLGGNNETGKIALANGKKQNVMQLVSGQAWLGGGGATGLLTLFPPGVDNVTDTGKATMFLDGKVGDVVVGGSGQDGDIFLRDGSGKTQMHLIGGRAWLGGGGATGLLTLFPPGVDNVTDTGKASIFLDGNTGDIVLQNADCAEDFDIADAETSEPGSLMVLDEQGRLRQSRQPYDRTVVGVLSGAGECRPGIVLDRRPSDNPRAALAMVGKVYCKVDATYNPISVGDLLTTSATPGHAMKAVDPQQAFGAVIGKALRAHREGPGLIPILAALQ
jgi:hypothetical protein